jgi:hypothetical protein
MNGESNNVEKIEDLKWKDFLKEHGMPENVKKEDCISSEDITKYDFDYIL